MRFTHEGKTYVIEFQREFKERLQHDPVTGIDYFVKSAKPYTTAKVLEEINTPGVSYKTYREHRTATVGCWHKEPHFSLAKGRVLALRLMSKTLDKEFKRAMWQAYCGRTAIAAKAQAGAELAPSTE